MNKNKNPLKVKLKGQTFEKKAASALQAFDKVKSRLDIRCPEAAVEGILIQADTAPDLTFSVSRLLGETHAERRRFTGL